MVYGPFAPVFAGLQVFFVDLAARTLAARPFQSLGLTNPTS
jgi:hypothetical protein